MFCFYQLDDTFFFFFWMGTVFYFILFFYNPTDPRVLVYTWVVLAVVVRGGSGVECAV